MLPRYLIDGPMSRFTVYGYASGLLSGLGHNPVVGIRDFTGEVHFDPDAVGQSSLSLKIRASSLEVQNNCSEKDRQEMKRTMDQEVLETATYPEITYDSSAVTVTSNSSGPLKVKLDGQLFLHGVKRPQPVPAQVFTMGGLLRANGEFTLRQTDYRIKPTSAVGGTLKLKDELKCTYEIVARLESGE